LGKARIDLYNYNLKGKIRPGTRVTVKELTEKEEAHFQPLGWKCKRNRVWGGGYWGIFDGKRGPF